MLLSFKVLCCVLLFLLLLILAKRWKYYKLMFKFHGPFGLPFIGYIYKFRKREDILKHLEEQEKLYGPVCLFWLGPIPFLMLSEPNMIQEVLTSPQCIDKSVVYQAVDDGTGRGLFSINDPEWSLHRKLLNPAFGHKVLMSFISIFNYETNKLLETFGDFSKADVNVIPTLQSYTLNVAAQTTMGKRVLNNDNPGNKDGLLVSYQSVLDNITNMIFYPWLRFEFIRGILGGEMEYAKAKNDIRSFVGDIINEKLSAETPDTNQVENKNIFLNLAIEHHKKGLFSKKNVEDESNVIVFGAFETTANTIAYTLLMLAMHPEYQEKAFEEIFAMFPEKAGMEVTFENTKEMVFMDMVLNETMRVMAPVPLVARQTTGDFKLSNGITIPKGVQIGINIFLLHRSKNIWGPDAHLFNPENFLPSNLSDKHPYAFIPFTKGIRNCIGWRYALLSAKVALAKLIRNYKFTTNTKFKDLIFVEEVTLKLGNNPLLQVHKRK